MLCVLSTSDSEEVCNMSNTTEVTAKSSSGMTLERSEGYLGFRWSRLVDICSAHCPTDALFEELSSRAVKFSSCLLESQGRGSK